MTETTADTIERSDAPSREATAGATPEATKAAPKKKPVRLIAILVLLIGAGCVGAWYWMHRGLESTDDAQVEAEIVSVPSRTSGIVVSVLVAENQLVKRGDPLVVLDDAQAKARLAQANADLASASAAAEGAADEEQIVEASANGNKSAAEATLQGASAGLYSTAEEIEQAKASVKVATVARDQAKTDLDRMTQLVASGAATRSQLDSAQSAFDAADAQLSQAKARVAVASSSTASAAARVSEAKARVGQSSAVGAQIEQAKAKVKAALARVDTAKAMRDLAQLDLDYTKIVAPRDGYASKKSASVGQMLQAGQPVMLIVPAGEAWITANFKETQLAQMRVGQKVEISIDAYPDLKVEGEVESFSGATGARFSLLPPDNATGNFTKVVQRVPVRIKLGELPKDRPLRPGMSVDVTVDTRK